MGLIQLLQFVLAITCCYAKFSHPFHPPVPHHLVLTPPLYRGGFHNYNMGNFISRRHVQILPPPMNSPPFNAIRYVKPKIFRSTKPLHLNMKSRVQMKPMRPMKQMKPMYRMKPFKPIKQIEMMNQKEMKYIKNSMKRKTPFIYLRIRPNRPPMYQPPSWINRRQPFPRPPIRIYRWRQSFEPPATPNRPQPQYPSRTYTPIPMPRHQPAYDIPRAQPPTFNDGTPPSKGEYVEPQVIPEDRRRHWLQTASGKINNFNGRRNDNGENSVDSEEKWEKRFEDFDEQFEDLLEKRKEGYYDNDGDNMLDDKIFESFDKMTRLRMNMARSRKYLDDFNKANGKDLDQEKYFENSDSRSVQQVQRFRSGRKHNYDEQYFDRKNDPFPQSSLPDQVNGRRQRIDTRRNSDDEKYFGRKRGTQGFLQTNRPFINMRSIGRSKNDDETYFETKSENSYGDKFIQRELNRRRLQQHNTRAIIPEASASFANRQSQRTNSGHQTINQVHRAKTQTNENGIARTSVTRQQVNFGDNTASIKSEQMIKYQKNNGNKYLETKDKFRRTTIKHLAEVQNTIGSQRQNRTFQRIRSSSMPKPSRFYNS